MDSVAHADWPPTYLDAANGRCHSRLPGSWMLTETKSGYSAPVAPVKRNRSAMVNVPACAPGKAGCQAGSMLRYERRSASIKLMSTSATMRPPMSPKHSPRAQTFGLFQDVVPKGRLTSPVQLFQPPLVLGKRDQPHRPRNCLARGEVERVSAQQIPHGQRVVLRNLRLGVSRGDMDVRRRHGTAALS